jgi:hypothetical protein
MQLHNNATKCMESETASAHSYSTFHMKYTFLNLTKKCNKCVRFVTEWILQYFVSFFLSIHVEHQYRGRIVFWLWLHEHDTAPCGSGNGSAQHLKDN